MSETKWTLGTAWQAPDAEHWYVTTDGYPIGRPSDVVCYGPQAEDHARLIAAAPTLYEALECALDEYEGREGRRLDPADPHWSVDARTALAKARGES